MKQSAVIVILAVALVAEGALTVMSIAQTDRAIATAKKWSSIADEWKLSAERFEAIADRNLKTARECIGILERRT